MGSTLNRILFSVCIFLYCSTYSWAFQQQDSATTDSIKTYKPSYQSEFNPSYRFGDPFSNKKSNSSFLLKDPAKLDVQVLFNPDTAAKDRGVSYNIYENINELNFRPATSMSFDKFDQYMNKKLNKAYFREKSAGLDSETPVSGRNLLPRLYISPFFDRIFGGSYVDIQPNGYINLDFGGRFQRVENPSSTLIQRRNGSFNFDQQMSLNLIGKVGEKLSISANIDNNSTFNFKNDLKVAYTGFEEDIIQRLEMGNVSLPISNSLITGAQSLFGIKTELKFGKLFITGIISQQRGKNENLTIEGGTQGKEFEILGSEYDENRHFFLGHFFRDNYERWLATLPQVTSGINITRLEVYVLNRNNDTETTRNIVAFMDLGESTNIFNQQVVPINPINGNPTRNQANTLDNYFFSGITPLYNVDAVNDYIGNSFSTFENATDYLRITTARKLNSTEYSYSSELGYISLVRRLQSDEILAVSYEYTFNGEVYKVGELTEDYQSRTDDEVIFLKLLRPNRINTEVPTWDLMMKNIYNLNASSVAREGFQLRIHYRDDNTESQDNPALHEGQRLKDIPLIQIAGLDQLNQNNDRQPDGNFDFIEKFTIDSKKGNIIFPTLEPFGKTLSSQFLESEKSLVEKYVFQDLYTSTKIEAQQNTLKNKFILVGKLTAGSSNVVKLPAINVAEGSIIVTAGNTILQEGTDYIVNYTLGEVSIINQGLIQSGKEINVSYEKEDVFNFRSKTLAGTRFDYRFSENFNIGGTLLYLNENRNGITTYAIGNEPIKNTKYGLDINFQKESRLITKVIDAIPLVNTKEPSSISFNAEVAQFIPGTSNIVSGEGTSYLDDFENALIPTNLMGWKSWNLASTPKKFNGQDVSSPWYQNDRRAKIAWYTIDNGIFYLNRSNSRPASVPNDIVNHYERPVFAQEIFRQRDLNQFNTNITLFDIAYFPEERGQYNYNRNSYEDVSGTVPEGLLPEPEQNWGGITRAITNEVNFNQNNVEYLEFWMLDPFIQTGRGMVLDGRINQNNTDQNGQLIFHLGNISEDLAPDGKHAFENGLPTDGLSVADANISTWGQITTNQILTNFFENSERARDYQDVGLDGLSNEDEIKIITTNGRTAGVFNSFTDVSSDNFRYVLDPFYDEVNAQVIQRYKNWNGMDGNSPIASGGNQITLAASTNDPDNEDLNNDNTISDFEAFFEYKIPIAYDPANQKLLKNRFVVDQITDLSGEANWYLFRIPIRTAGTAFGSPDFNDIKYVRMMLTGWENPVVLRFAKMQLVGSKWRKYEQALFAPGLNEIPNAQSSDFFASAVNVEENSRYELPPGIDRNFDNTNPNTRRINEQSLQICVENLKDRDGRAVFKNVNLDLVNFGNLKMFLHAESYKGEGNVQDDEINAFLRLGTDDKANYYEIELPLKITPLSIQGSSDELRRLTWPLENELDVNLYELIGLKSERNRAGKSSDVPYSSLSNDQKYKFTILGNPDISAVKVLMIGVRNPIDEVVSPRSLCIWADELRVTDFNRMPGWAGNARLNIKLADLGAISASTRHSSIGFGNIQHRISERSRTATTQYDISTNLDVGKFFRPDKTGLVIPMFVSYDKSIIVPQFDPLDPDVPLEASIISIDTEKERNEYRKIVIDRTTRRSLNFTNIRKQKVKQESTNKIYDIANFSFSYAYSDRTKTNSNLFQLFDKTQSIGINYNFSPKPFSVEPLKNTEALSSPYFALLKDFNFSPTPSNLSFSGNLRRNYRETTYFTNRLTPDLNNTQYERLFTFNRSYIFNWNFTKNLKLNYNASANAVIDEPEQNIEGDINTIEERQFIWNQILGLGRMKNFKQDVSLNYKLPLDKIPFTNWLSTSAKYTVSYGWTAGSIIQPTLGAPAPDSLYFGNFINNNRNISLNGQANIDKIYDKITFLKNAKTDGENNKTSLGKRFLRFLMMLKSISGSYGINESTSLPGFRPSMFLFGLDSSFQAPGLPFIFGSQNPNIRTRAANNNWLVKNSNLNSPFQQSYGTNLNIQAKLSPIKDFNLQLIVNQKVNNKYQEIFRFNGLDNFEILTPSRSGSYSISFLSIKTAFESQNENNTSKTFSQFEQNLGVVQEALSLRNTGGIYDTLSQDILIPAFVAAYSGTKMSNINYSPFPKIPLPNWRADYAGLSKIPAISEVFSSFTFSHGYSSSYSVSNFTNSLNYGTDIIGLQNDILNYPLAQNSENGDLVPVYIINQVLISEQFSPLIGINIRTKNNLSARLEYKKSRTLSLNMSNAQVTETLNNEFVVDFGYSAKGLKLPFRSRGRVITLKNDIAFRIASSVKNSSTIQRKIFDESLVTNGNSTFQIRPTLTYMINKRINLTSYFERNINTPKVLRSPKRATTAFGIQLRISLSQ